jgi:hypothetical protein
MTAFFISLLLLLAGCAAPVEEIAAAPNATENKSPAVDLSQIATRCFPTDALIKGLFESHRETQIGLGILRVPEGSEPAVVSLFRAPLGSWTMVVSSANGVSCLIIWGEKWINQKTPKGGV